MLFYLLLKSTLYMSATESNFTLYIPQASLKGNLYGLAKLVTNPYCKNSIPFFLISKISELNMKI